MLTTEVFWVAAPCGLVNSDVSKDRNAFIFKAKQLTCVGVDKVI
jgi:hypothetical protein